MGNEREILIAAYRDFNARRIDAVLARMAPGVVWPNGLEGGFVHGHNGVCDYWTRQWQILDPKVEPMEIHELPDGRFAVEVHQVVHDLEGKLLLDTKVRHVYQIHDNLIERMDIE